MRDRAEASAAADRYSGHSFDWQTGSLPFGIAVLKPTDAIASRAECRDRIERENAIRTTAIGDDFAADREFAQALLQFAERDIEGAGKMPERKLVFRPHVENRDKAVTQPRDQLLSRYRLQRVACMEIVGHDTIDLGYVSLAHASERPHQVNHLIVASEPV